MSQIRGHDYARALCHYNYASHAPTQQDCGGRCLESRNSYRRLNYRRFNAGSCRSEALAEDDLFVPNPLLRMLRPPLEGLRMKRAALLWPTTVAVFALALMARANPPPAAQPGASVQPKAASQPMTAVPRQEMLEGSRLARSTRSLPIRVWLADRARAGAVDHPGRAAGCGHDDPDEHFRQDCETTGDRSGRP